MVKFNLVMEGGSDGIGAINNLKNLGKELMPDKEADLKEVRYITYDDNQSKGGFRLIIANEVTGWVKAVRVYTKPGSDQWTEVKAGDKSGNVAKSNQHIRYDTTRVDFPSNQDFITLNIMKPGFLGVYSTVDEIRIYSDRYQDYDGKTVVFYYNNDNSRYFNQDKNIIQPSDF